MCGVAIDAGTSLVKAVVFTEDGREAVVVREQAAVSRPHPGHAEQDMLARWGSVVTAVRRACAELREPVSFLAITAQGDGCWLVDDNGKPTGPAVLWNDGRAGAIVERWRDDGVLAEAFRHNGTLTFAGLPNAILAWLAEHAPQRLADSATVLTCGGWLYLQLTGRTVADESDASAPFLDMRTRDYSDELCALFGLGAAERLLPPVLRDPKRAGELQPAAAAELGLPSGIPVVLGPYDIAAAAIGCGVTAPGQMCVILGTTLCVEFIDDDPARVLAGQPSGSTVTFGAGKVLRAFPSLAGTDSLSWAAETLGFGSPSQLVDVAAQVEDTAGLMVLPYLSPAGERTPILQPRARGTVLGLTMDHGREHLARAVLEGLSLKVRDCLEDSGAKPEEIRLCGGGARSDFWTQMIADATGTPVVRPRSSESSARGAVTAALNVVHGATDVFAPAADLALREACEPDRASAARFTELYQEFLDRRVIATSDWERAPG